MGLSIPSHIQADQQRFQDAKKNPQAASAEIQAWLQESSVAVSWSTVRRQLNKNWLHGQVGRKKKEITVPMPQNSTQYVKQPLDKPPNFWNSRIWNDETKIKLYGQQGLWWKVHHPYSETWRRSTWNVQSNPIVFIKHI